MIIIFFVTVLYSNTLTYVYRARFLPMKIWQNGIVPVVIDKQIANNPTKVEAILRAMNVFAQYTCINFRKRTKEKDYIKIVDGGQDRCYSFVGRIGGKQVLSLGSGCDAQVGVILHEMNHALGMLHEHSRPDRDDYITINYDAVKDGYYRNFQKYENEVADTLGLPYDYASIMHYHPFAFSRNGQMTIIPKDFYHAKDVMGQREGFSGCDLAKLNRLYGCQRDNNPKCEGGKEISATTSSPKATPATTKGHLVNDNCKDDHPDCVRVKNNPDLCVRRPGIFMLNCKKSCNNCNGTACFDGRGFPANNVCGRHTPKHCGYSNVDAWCPASCGLC